MFTKEYVKEYVKDWLWSILVLGFGVGTIMTILTLICAATTR